MNAAERSSMIVCSRKPSVRLAAHANGVEREPGLSQTSCTPACLSDAKTSRAHSPSRWASLGAAASGAGLTDIQVANPESERSGRHDAKTRFDHQGLELFGRRKGRDRLLQVAVLGRTRE